MSTLRPKAHNDEKILMEVCRTFDMSRLSDMSQESADIIKSLLDETKSVSQKQHAFVQMVGNHLNPVLVKKDVVKGPSSLSEHYSERMGVHVYLFGDRHIESTISSDNDEIPQFLTELVRWSDKFIDIYLDVPKDDKNLNENAAYFYMEATKKRLTTFSGILPNMRLHSTRVPPSKNTNINNLLDLLANIQNSEGLPDFVEHIRNLSKAKILKKYVTLYSLGSHILNVCTTFAKVNKQIHMTRPELSEELKKYHNELLVDLESQLSSEDLFDQNVVDICESYITDATDSVATRRLWLTVSYLVSLLTSQLSLYTVGRMLRSFSDVKGVYSKQPRHIIVYTAEYLARDIAFLLDRFGFRNPRFVQESPNNRQQIDLTSFRQPLFS